MPFMDKKDVLIMKFPVKKGYSIRDVAWLDDDGEGMVILEKRKR